jgi:hypothetical protein
MMSIEKSADHHIGLARPAMPGAIMKRSQYLVHPSSTPRAKSPLGEIAAGRLSPM